MHPDLFHIGPLTVRTYGFAMAVSFLLGYWLAARRASREGFDPELVLDCFLPSFIGAILGARILYVATDLSTYMKHPLNILKIWEGGLVWYGGFLGSILGVYIFLRIKKQSFWKFMDLMTPYGSLGYAIHRSVGCFGGFGCCYGKPTDLPFPIGVIFPETSPAARYLVSLGFEPNHRVFATQLFEAANGLVIMAVAMIIRSKNHRVGQVSGAMFVIYSIVRFFVEFVRGDEYRGFLYGISTSQWISFPILALGIYLLLRKAEPATMLNKEEAAKFLENLYAAEGKKDSEKQG